MAANPYALLQKPVDYASEKKKADDRALNQLDRYIEQAKVRDQQWVDAQEQKRDLLFKIAEFAPTAVKTGMKINEGIKQKQFAKWTRLGITEEVLGESQKLIQQDKSVLDNLDKEDNKLIQLLRSRGVDPQAAKVIAKNGGSYSRRLKEFAGTQTVVNLQTTLEKSPKFKDFLETIKHHDNPTLRQNKIRNWIREPGNVFHLPYKDTFYERVLSKDVEATVNDISNKLTVKNNTIQTEAEKVQNKQTFDTYFQSDDESSIGEIYIKQVNNFAEQIPEKINGEVNPDYAIRYQLAEANATKHLEDVLRATDDQGVPLVSPGQFNNLKTSLMQHRGRKSANNPEGFVEISDGLWTQDTAIDLTRISNEAWTNYWEGADERAKQTKINKLSTGLRYVQSLPVEQRAAAFQTVVNDIGGADSLDEKSKTRVKNLSRIFRLPNVEESLIEALGNDNGISESDLNAIKVDFPETYNNYNSANTIMKSDKVIKSLGQAKGLVVAATEWDLTAKPNLDGNPANLATSLTTKYRKLIRNDVLALPIEGRNDAAIAGIINNRLAEMNTEWDLGSGNKAPVTSDAELEGQYHFNSDKGVFSLWQAGNENIKHGESFISIVNNTKNKQERNVDPYAVKEGKESTAYFTKAAVENMISENKVTQRANIIADTLNIEGGGTALIMGTAEALGVDTGDLGEKTKTVQQILNEDPYLRHWRSTNAPLSHEAFKRMNEKALQKEEEKQEADKTAARIQTKRDKVKEHRTTVTNKERFGDLNEQQVQDLINRVTQNPEELARYINAPFYEYLKTLINQ